MIIILNYGIFVIIILNCLLNIKSINKIGFNNNNYNNNHFGNDSENIKIFDFNGNKIKEINNSIKQILLIFIVIINYLKIIF